MGYKWTMTDETLKFILTALGGATVGAVIAGLFALFNSWRTDVRERNKWHRQQKMDAYVLFLEDIQRFIHAFSRFHDHGPTTLSDAKKAGHSIRNEQLLIVAPAEVRHAQRILGNAVVTARRYLDTIDPKSTERTAELTTLSLKLGAERDAFLVAVQKDLKLDIGQAPELP